MIVKTEFDLLVQWIERRESVRRLKEAGQPKPWTDDPLLRGYRWCNVKRLDDKVSRWLFNSFYGWRTDWFTTAIAACTLGRLVNWPDALSEVSHQSYFTLSHLDGAETILSARQQRKEKTFTAAYIVPPIAGIPSKAASIVRTVRLVAADADSLALLSPSLRATWERLCKFEGIGPFLAGQIVADMAMFLCCEHWPDSRMWAPMGPGSKRGMNRLHGRHKDQALKQPQFDFELSDLCMALYKSSVYAIWLDRRLFAMDVQNCLCEFDKYRRLTLGEGSVRSRYPGAA